MSEESIVEQSSDDETPVINLMKSQTKTAGLVNLGATCYLNSLLQVLFSLRPFREAVYSLEDKGNLNDIPSALREIFYHMQTQTKVVSTERLTNAFGWKGEDLVVQHDIQELATKLFDVLTSKMKGSKHEYLHRDLFEGKQEQCIECCDGTYTSRRAIPFYELQLEVRNHNDVCSSLRQITEPEKLTGPNKYRVEYDDGSPAQYKDAIKRIVFRKLPPILMLHLKRFEMDFENDLQLIKINDKYMYPESIDFAEFVSENEKCHINIPYELWAVVVHCGTSHNGHYKAYIRTMEPTKKENEANEQRQNGVKKESDSGDENQTSAAEWGSWFEFDDETVKPSTRESAMTELYGGFTRNAFGHSIPRTGNAYLLLYVDKSKAVELISSMDITDIPHAVRAEFEAQRRKRLNEEREQERKNALVHIKVLTHRDLAHFIDQYTWGLWTDHLDPDRAQTFTLQYDTTKQDNLHGLALEVASSIGVPSSHQRYHLGLVSVRERRKHYVFSPRVITDESLHLSIGELFQSELRGCEGAWSFVLLLEPSMPRCIPLLDIVSNGIASSSSHRDDMPPESCALVQNGKGFFAAAESDRHPYWKLDLGTTAHINYLVFTTAWQLPSQSSLVLTLLGEDGTEIYKYPLSLAAPTRGHRPGYTVIGHATKGLDTRARYVQVKKRDSLSLFALSTVMVVGYPTEVAVKDTEVGPNDSFLVFLKSITHHGMLRFMGCVYIKSCLPVIAYTSYFRTLLGVEDSAILNFAIESSDPCEDETVPLSTPLHYVPLHSLNGIRDGFTLLISSTMKDETDSCPDSTLQDFTQRLEKLHSVRFVKCYSLAAPTVIQFRLRVKSDASYERLCKEVRKSLESQLGVECHESNIQLTAPSLTHDGPQRCPLPSYNPFALEEHLSSSKNGSRSPYGYELWYSILKSSRKEVEAHGNITISFHHSSGEEIKQNGVPMSKMCSVKLGFKVSDLLRTLQLNPADWVMVKYLTDDCLIYETFDQDMALPTIPDENFSYRLYKKLSESNTAEKTEIVRMCSAYVEHPSPTLNFLFQGGFLRLSEETTKKELIEEIRTLFEPFKSNKGIHIQDVRLMNVDKQLRNYTYHGVNGPTPLLSVLKRSQQILILCRDPNKEKGAEFQLKLENDS